MTITEQWKGQGPTAHFGKVGVTDCQEVTEARDKLLGSASMESPYWISVKFNFNGFRS
ncbi:hypothetical protein [Fodinibius salinus]|uniref:hypothetical protein n=1 Tax=Fodinibius salinus TaxID=860790 RepID=UPI0014782E4A|nr:hypothetical protein [Fodinibius salinus]